MIMRRRFPKTQMNGKEESRMNRNDQRVKGPALLTASDFPDPSVIRAGDTYYLASTTMHFFPGCALLKSHDLIQWEWCGHVFDSIDGLPLRRLENGENCYGKGMWAPSLRYHQGTFYLCFTSADTHTTWLYRTADIEHGPWTKQEIRGYHHDPSLFFDDDGKTYIVSGNTEIRLAELNDDLTDHREGGLSRIIARSHVEPMLGYEGSHLEKVDGRYYLFTIHSLAAEWRRVETCLRADRLDGEFSGGIVLNDDMGYHGMGVAQGGIVDTPDGRWFAVLFQDRGAVGRTPVLVPMRWENGMPVLGTDGNVPMEAENTSTRPGWKAGQLACGDDFTAEEPADMWEWNHEPDPEGWRMGNGRLRLTARNAENEMTQVRNMLTMRATWPVTEASVTVDGRELNPGDRGGICALQADWICVFIERTEDGFVLGWQEAGKEPVYAGACGETAELKLRMDFRDMRDEVTVLAKTGEEWKVLNAVPHRVRFDLKHFCGVRAGLFCQALKTAGGTAEFRKYGYAVLQG